MEVNDTCHNRIFPEEILLFGALVGGDNSGETMCLEILSESNTQTCAYVLAKLLLRNSN